MRASLRPLFLLLPVAAMAVASPAFAANPQLELAAKKALKKAEGDYLAMGYAAGAARLKKAAAACGASGCEPRTKAALVCDLGTMLFRQGDKAGAARAWKIAVKLKPDVALNPAYDQPDVSAAFAAATGGAPPRAAADGGSAKGPAEKKEAAAAPESTRTESETEGEGKGKSSGETGDGEGEGGNGRKKREEKDAASEGRPFRRFWLGASFGIEFMELPTGTDLCHVDAVTADPDDPNHMYCTALNGADFPPRTQTGMVLNNPGPNTGYVPGEWGQSNGGLQRANARILVTADYAVTKNLLLGARGGMVFFTYPGQAAVVNGRTSPYGMLHLEARATWVFGENPFGSDGFAPLVFFGGGISQFDASTTSSVTVMQAGTAPVTGGVDIWKTAGPGFVTAGGGVRWAPIAEFGVTLAARANLAWGNGTVVTFGPEVGVAYGF